MLYPTLNQGVVFVCLFAAGLAGGALFDLANIFLVFCNNNKIVKHILHFFCTLLSFLMLYIVNFTTNLGQLRLYVVLSFLFAFMLERTLFGRLISKTITKLDSAYKRRRALPKKDK